MCYDWYGKQYKKVVSDMSKELIEWLGITEEEFDQKMEEMANEIETKEIKK
jgi:hypothetical protein